MQARSPVLIYARICWQGVPGVTSKLALPVAADSLLAAILWSVITYYPVGLAPEASRFFTFVLILFVVHSMVGHRGQARVLLWCSSSDPPHEACLLAATGHLTCVCHRCAGHCHVPLHCSGLPKRDGGIDRRRLLLPGPAAAGGLPACARRWTVVRWAHVSMLSALVTTSCAGRLLRHGICINRCCVAAVQTFRHGGSGSVSSFPSDAGISAHRRACHNPVQQRIVCLSPCESWLTLLCTLCRADWANPVSYIQQAIAINEFKAPRWQNVPAPGYANAGEAILIQRGVHTDEWWIWLVSECAEISVCFS